MTEMSDLTGTPVSRARLYDGMVVEFRGALYVTRCAGKTPELREAISTVNLRGLTSPGSIFNADKKECLYPEITHPVVQLYISNVHWSRATAEQAVNSPPLMRAYTTAEGDEIYPPIWESPELLVA